MGHSLREPAAVPEEAGDERRGGTTAGADVRPGPRPAAPAAWGCGGGGIDRRPRDPLGCAVLGAPLLVPGRGSYRVGPAGRSGVVPRSAALSVGAGRGPASVRGGARRLGAVDASRGFGPRLRMR